MTLAEYTTRAVKLTLELDKLNNECLKQYGRHPIKSTISKIQAIQELDIEAINLPHDIKKLLLKHRNKTQDTIVIPTKLLKRRYSHELKLHRINNYELIKEVTALINIQCNSQGHRVSAELLRPKEVEI